MIGSENYSAKYRNGGTYETSFTYKSAELQNSGFSSNALTSPSVLNVQGGEGLYSRTSSSTLSPSVLNVEGGKGLYYLDTTENPAGVWKRRKYSKV